MIKRISLASIVAFAFAIALSVSPQLHERLHHDAQNSNHECAVTLIAAGNFHHVAAAPFIADPAPFAHFESLPNLTPLWVASPFAHARVFEHAPPLSA
ncbi:MAG: hypothetical protein M3R59_10090 [Verrucomicrobiota bacterium]|nr:hypothetical protein [Verrucomicrobiota bacterium]